MWYGDAKMKYPKQWIVLVNISNESSNRTIGDVYFVTSDKKEAYAIVKTLGQTMGDTMVVAGFDDTPQIGGLYACNQ
jgi:hypothetical protein